MHTNSQDISLGEVYPYAVALPENNTEAAPPAVVFLGGKGSLFSQQDTQSRDTVVAFGGIGWNVARYANGSTDEADTMAAQRLVAKTQFFYHRVSGPCCS